MSATSVVQQLIDLTHDVSPEFVKQAVGLIKFIWHQVQDMRAGACAVQNADAIFPYIRDKASECARIRASLRIAVVGGYGRYAT